MVVYTYEPEDVATKPVAAFLLASPPSMYAASSLTAHKKPLFVKRLLLMDEEEPFRYLL
jgi:hypothetical protein